MEGQLVVDLALDGAATSGQPQEAPDSFWAFHGEFRLRRAQDARDGIRVARSLAGAIRKDRSAEFR